MQSISDIVFEKGEKGLLNADQGNFFGSPSLAIFSLKYDLDRQIITGLKDGTVRVYDTINPSKVEYYSSARGQILPAVSVRWIPNQKRHFLSLNASGIVLYCDELLHDLTYIKTNEAQTLTMDVCTTGTSFAISTKQNKIGYYDIEKAVEISHIPPGQLSNNFEGHTNHIYALKFISESQMLSGGWDSTVRLWDIRTSKQQSIIHGPNISGDGIDYSSGEVLTASYRNEDQLQQWDLGSGKLIHTYIWDEKDLKKAIYLYNCKFGFGKLQNYVVASGDSKGEVKVFDVHSKKCELTAKGRGNNYSLDVSKSGFCFGGETGVAHLINIK